MSALEYSVLYECLVHSIRSKYNELVHGQSNFLILMAELKLTSKMLSYICVQNIYMLQNSLTAPTVCKKRSLI